jgi:signal transduction histidine kinase
VADLPGAPAGGAPPAPPGACDDGVVGGDVPPRPEQSLPVWESMFTHGRLGWHLLFGLITGLAAVFLVADGHASRLFLVAILVGAYVVASSPLGDGLWAGDRGTGRRGTLVGAAYLAVAYTVVALLAWTDPNTLVLLFVMFPQAFIFLPVRLSVVAALVLSALYSLVLLGRDHWSSQALQIEGIGGVLTAVFAIAIGLFISGLVRQSEQRRLLIAELTAAQHQRDEARRAADVAAERERLARDIHDTLAQSFISIVMLVQAAQAAVGGPDPAATEQRLEQIDATARDGLAEARALVAEMHPAVLDGQSLEGALERLVQRFGAETGLAASFASDGRATEPRSAHCDIVLMRAAQEGLANVRRHAGARRVAVSLHSDHGARTLEVADDGRGFDPFAPSAGYGLAGMRARVDEVDGDMHVESSARGTTLRVTVGAGGHRPLGGAEQVMAP